MLEGSPKLVHSSWVDSVPSASLHALLEESPQAEHSLLNLGLSLFKGPFLGPLLLTKRLPNWSPKKNKAHLPHMRQDADFEIEVLGKSETVYTCPEYLYRRDELARQNGLRIAVSEDFAL